MEIKYTKKKKQVDNTLYVQYYIFKSKVEGMECMKNNMIRVAKYFLSMVLVIGSLTIPFFASASEYTGVASSGYTKIVCWPGTHSYKSEVTKEATCTATGTITYSCRNCDETYTEKIPKTDHNFAVTEEVTGTCIEKGYQVETCTECGFAQTVEGTYGDHDLEVNGEQIEPTCEDPGLKTEQCKICFEVFTTELPALGHEYESTSTIDNEAYCVVDGEKSNHCIRCDARINNEKIPALGHEEVIEEKEAGIFANGYLKITCARCEQVLKNDIYLSFVNTYKPFVIAGVVLLVGVAALVTLTVIKRRKKKMQ